MPHQSKFRTLFGEFLFRAVDRELLSTYANGDVSQLLLRFLTLLIFGGLVFAAPAVLLPDRMSAAATTLVAWSTVSTLLATTMLVVGVVTVFSWNSSLPERLDVLVLATLLVRPSTVFAAKLTAAVAGVGLAVGALNLAPSLLWPLRLHGALAQGVILDISGGPLALSPPRFGYLQLVAAYWLAVVTAAVSVFGLVLLVQGVACLALRRSAFLRTSAILQLGFLGAFVSAYVLLPIAISPGRLTAFRQGGWVQAPWYWFVSVFQMAGGHQVSPALVTAAWWMVALAVVSMLLVYPWAYRSALGRIAEEPDLAPRSWLTRAWPSFGTPAQTAVVQFTVRTLFRSAPHRVILACYWGFGFGVTLAFARLLLPRFDMPSVEPWQRASMVIVVSSLFLLLTSVWGARAVISLPKDLRANWIFRVTPMRAGVAQLRGRRRAFAMLAVVPVWGGTALAVTAQGWPWTHGVGLLVILGVLAGILTELHVRSIRTIPFTCSYLPGPATYQAALWAGALFVLMGTVAAGAFLRRSLDSPLTVVALSAGLTIVWVVLRHLVTATEGRSVIEFEAAPDDLMTSLGLSDHRPLPAAERRADR